jgi:hypothetical protein
MNQGATLTFGSNCLAADPELRHRTLRVGPNERLSRPSMAASIAKDGDTIEIDAGTYEADAVVWTQNNLILRGIGGRARLIAKGAHAEGKAIWVIKGNNTIVENIEFTGATVPLGNGAGIRQEGADLTVRNCYFHFNQNGILTAPNPKSDILVESSEFSNNGNGEGNTHNIYIGTVRSFTLRASYVHHARVGHNVKSRALTNYILYNRIMDEDTGNASYEIDLPNGGRSFIIGNLIQKGQAAENFRFVAYAAEGMTNPLNQLYIVNNTFVNDRLEGGQFVFLKAQPQYVKVINNIFAGPGTVLQGGAGEFSHNLISTRSDFKDAKNFDYHLTSHSAAIDAGTDPGAADEFSLWPVDEYVPNTGKTARPVLGRIDIGAYEYQQRIQ